MSSSIGPISSSYPQPNASDFEAYFSTFDKSNSCDQAHALVSKANAFFKSQRAFHTPVKCDLRDLQGTDPEALFKDIYAVKDFSGLCIGEQRHTHLAPKELLIRLIPLWKAVGITTFFLEHIKSGSMQKDLDRSFKTGRWADLAPETVEFLEKLDKRNHLLFSPYSYTSLVKAFIQAGIRVVAIDSRISAIAGRYEDLPAMEEDERIPAANYTAKQIMDKTIRKEKLLTSTGKSITLVGAKHGSKMKNLKVPGISESMHWPCFIVADASEHKKPDIYLNPESLQPLGYYNEEGTVHAVLVMEKPAANFSPRRNTAPSAF